MSKDIIKPCPFCGGEAIIEVINPHSHIFSKFMPDYKGGAFVSCVKCGCGMSDDTITGVVDKWNTRYMDSYVEQLRWERDVAISQLEELGIGFGENVEDKVVISKLETNTKSKGSD